MYAEYICITLSSGRDGTIRSKTGGISALCSILPQRQIDLILLVLNSATSPIRRLHPNFGDTSHASLRYLVDTCSLGLLLTSCIRRHASGPVSILKNTTIRIGT